MSKFDIAIIGLGPRGLALFERICARLKSDVSRREIVIHIIDPNECGQGAHYARQPRNLLINTVAGQVTMFADPSVTLVGPLVTGPSLAQWARDHGYRKISSTYVQSQDQTVGLPVDDNDYLPRSMLGDYLSWCFDEIAGSCPPCVKVVFHRNSATDIEVDAFGRRRVRLRSEFSFLCDYVFLTTGHGRNRPDARDIEMEAFVSMNASRNGTLQYFRSAYPLDRLRSIPPKARVAVAGMGLSAHDVISELTIGRGGLFQRSSSRCQYRPSGREPKMFLFSRQGLPFAARGRNQKGNSGQYKARFFTMEAIRLLQRRAAVDGVKPHFATEIWPLILKEMIYVHQCARQGFWTVPEEYSASEEDVAAVTTMLNPMICERFQDLASFDVFVRRHLAEDLAHADVGNVDDPLKAASDVLRDTRDTLRLAIDQGASLSSSHREMLEKYVPTMNRLAVGPPRSRNRELLALMDAGVVEVGGGPGAVCLANQDEACFDIVSKFGPVQSTIQADVLVVARIEPFFPERDDSILIENLMRRGTIRPFTNGTYHPGGIDIDADDHPIGLSGAPNTSIWAMGNITEGANFYTYVLPRPGVNSRFIKDADRCVGAMLDAMEACGAPAQDYAA